MSKRGAPEEPEDDAGPLFTVQFPVWDKLRAGFYKRLAENPPEHAHARSTDPQTSHDAAASVRNQETLRALVLSTLRAHGPMRDDELVAGLVPRYTPSGIRTRRKELVALGLVVDSGRREKTKSNRDSIVWEASAPAP